MGEVGRPPAALEVIEIRTGAVLKASFAFAIESVQGHCYSFGGWNQEGTCERKAKRQPCLTVV